MLGRTYFKEWDADAAWLAWEIGRSIAPDHECWVPLRRQEAQLQWKFADLL